VTRTLRPPGAKKGREFNALCIRCYRCVSACPYKSLAPAGWSAGREVGVPVVVARDVPCYLCMECPPVCPTGALDPIRDKRAVRMGLAVVDEETCYAFQGILCRTCVDKCPFPDDAIYLDAMLMPRVTDKCVGCGICEKVCPSQKVAIRVRAT
jgi:MauM/NapG family ferredoxin protein